MKLAIDVASGENPVEDLVLGCIDALKDNSEVSLILVGDRREIEPVLSKAGSHSNRITVHHTDEVIAMSDSPAIAIKHKRDASVVVAARMVKTGEAAAFFSPGNTGATLSASLTEIGRLKGVMRPPLMSTMPKMGGEFYILDVGANADCNPDYLCQFAVMGAVFAKRYRGIHNPRVALLNIGEEDGKGNDLYKKTFEALEKVRINFVGNIEPNDMLKYDKADVVVADGFTGNIVLKTLEGTASFIISMIKEDLKSKPVSTVGALLMKSTFSHLKKSTSADAYGSAVLLGLNGGAFIGHGKTTRLGMVSSINTMSKFLKAKVNENIIKEIQYSGVKKKGLF